MYSSVKFSRSVFDHDYKTCKWDIHFFICTPLPYGRYNQIISRRTLLESDISTTLKGFGISILPTRACQILGLFRLLQGLWELGDLGPVGITI